MKSITLRNLLGGFLGGIAGILMSWFIALIALPFGVLLGVIVGWYNLEIFRALAVSTSNISSQTRKLAQVSTRLIPLAGKFFPTLTRVGVGIRHLATRFFTWQSAHPANRISMIKAIVYVLVPMIGFGHFLDRIARSDTVPMLIGYLTMLLFLGMMGGIVIRAWIEATNSQNPVPFDVDSMKHFYRQWEVHSRYGDVGFAVYDAWRHIKFAIGTSVFIALELPLLLLYVVLGAPLIIIAVMLWLVCYLITPLLTLAYKIAFRRAHLLCLGVTLTVTTLSWLKLSHTFVDARMLWFVSLSTGVVSGVLTELLRLAYVHIYQRVERMNLKLDLQLDPITDRLSNICLYWFRNSPQARRLRAICFEMPIEQPVRIV